MKEVYVVRSAFAGVETYTIDGEKVRMSGPFLFMRDEPFVDRCLGKPIESRTAAYRKWERMLEGALVTARGQVARFAASLEACRRELGETT